jgi:predicted acylesterase/phospholipase RssA
MGKYFILACDGGGIRGYITASVLQRLVEEPGLGDLLPQVSLRAGTSTGSFIALALARGVPIAQVRAMYQQESARRIFTRNPVLTGEVAVDEDPNLRERLQAGLAKARHVLTRRVDDLVHVQYTNAGIAQALQALLGPTARLADLAPVVVDTLVLDDDSVSPSTWMPRTLSNLGVSPVASMFAWEAGLCSGAAPIYFPPYRPESAPLGYCVDGGLYANNPSLSAIVGALAQGVPLGEIYLLSLDTGTTYESMPAAVIDDEWGGPLRMGPLAWMSPEARITGTEVTPKFPLLAALTDAGVTAIAENARTLLGPRYHRVAVPLTGPVLLDDTSDAAYASMDVTLASFYASGAYAAATAWLRAAFPAG